MMAQEGNGCPGNCGSSVRQSIGIRQVKISRNKTGEAGKGLDHERRHTSCRKDFILK